MLLPWAQLTVGNCPRCGMIRDNAEMFHTASDEQGGIGLPSPKRHNTGASPAPATTMLWPENTPTT
jgi:hypothetical protein